MTTDEIKEAGKEFFGAMSPGMALVFLTTKHNHEVGELNTSNNSRAVNEALCFAIREGFRFDNNDFVHTQDHDITRPLVGTNEDTFTLACKAKNVSACIAYEQKTKRKPFFYDKTRVYVGRVIYFNPGRPLRCTSFAKDGSYFIAVPHNAGTKKELLKITREHLKGVKL
jgi:hypothetical protein